jgi:2'-5' RNA ligase
MPLQKYFLAIVLPSPFLQEVEQIKHQLFLKYGLKGALRCPAHITLHRPFIWKEEKESLLLEKLNLFKAGPRFQIQLQNFGFFEPGVAFVNVLPNSALNNLHSNLKDFAKKKLHLFNEAEDMRGFHPHVTIASRDLKKKVFDCLKPEFSEQTYKAEISVDQFSLLKLNKAWEIKQNFPI